MTRSPEGGLVAFLESSSEVLNPLLDGSGEVSLVFYLSYMLAELRRRSGRTLLTALGLAVGVGLVVAVSALSKGLDDAQAKVLEPLTGVGTDMSVTRPIRFGEDGPGGLSESEREALREEAGGARFGLRNLGQPGERFERDDFLPTGQLSFPASTVADIRSNDGVQDAAGSLTLNAIHVEGVVPELPANGAPTFRTPGAGPPENIDIENRSVTGVDVSKSSLGAITPSQIVRGRYLSADKAETVLNLAYAQQNNIALGDKVKLGSQSLTVVGFARTPLGGQASDLYVELGRLQKLADREGRVNTINVRAESADQVDEVATQIRNDFEGASVTTAEDLAGRVSGSLVDARKLADRLGTALVLVALLAAFLIASLLTLSSVTKRIRELGTLKALGWPQRLVVRQVSGEALLQGLLGGLLGIVVGVAGALLIEAAAPSLKATFAEAASQGPRFFGPGGGGGGPFGQGQVADPSTTVEIGAPISVNLMLAAVGLALLGGLIAGAVGGLRAARLRPADALRHID
jgi:ABC-type antimicrobial peptide transport system permease subunit